jgi:hypothetical protein
MVTRKKVKVDTNSVTLEPTIVVGTHLTVTTWPDGRAELKWDDEALLKEVQNAILKYESNIPVTAKPAKKAAAKKTVAKKEPAKKTAAKKTTPKKTKK